MKLAPKRRIAADVLGVGENRVWLDPERLADIKEAITKADIRGLVAEGAIKAKTKTGISKGRSKKVKIQKSKGRRKGLGSRKGTSKARLPRKKIWMNAIRSQRDFITLLRDKLYIEQSTYRLLRRRAKGGLFRSKRHIRLFLEDKGLLKSKK